MLIRRSYPFVLGLAALGAAVLTGCDDVPRTSAVRAVEDPWALVQGAGPIPVIVHGRPAGADAASAGPEALRETVFRAVEQALTWSGTSPFVPGEASDPARGLRLVFAFDAGSGVCEPIAADRQPPRTTASPPREVGLVAALCDGPRPLARVDGRVACCDGLGDRRLGMLVTQATLELLAPPGAPQP